MSTSSALSDSEVSEVARSLSTTTTESDSEAPPLSTSPESSDSEEALPFAPRDSSPFNAYPYDDLKKALYFDMTMSTAIAGLPKNQKNHVLRTLRERFLESGHPESAQAATNAEVKAHVLNMYALGCRIFSDKHADSKEALEELARSQRFDDVWVDDNESESEASSEDVVLDTPKMLWWSGAECAVADDGEAKVGTPHADAANLNEAVLSVLDAEDAQDEQVSTAQTWNAWSHATALDLFDFVPPSVKHASEVDGLNGVGEVVEDGKHALRLMSVMGWRDERCGCTDGFHHEFDTRQTHAFQSAEGTVMVMREKSIVLPLN